jgi:hypothetical protein
MLGRQFLSSRRRSLLAIRLLARLGQLVRDDVRTQLGTEANFMHPLFLCHFHNSKQIVSTTSLAEDVLN